MKPGCRRLRFSWACSVPVTVQRTLTCYVSQVKGDYRGVTRKHGRPGKKGESAVSRLACSAGRSKFFKWEARARMGAGAAIATLVMMLVL